MLMKKAMNSTIILSVPAVLSGCASGKPALQAVAESQSLTQEELNELAVLIQEFQDLIVMEGQRSVRNCCRNATIDMLKAENQRGIHTRWRCNDCLRPLDN